jgi:hypothetical protein
MLAGDENIAHNVSAAASRYNTMYISPSVHATQERIVDIKIHGTELI